MPVIPCSSAGSGHRSTPGRRLQLWWQRALQAGRHAFKPRAPSLDSLSARALRDIGLRRNPSGYQAFNG